ncbi:MAG TPA: AtpZ/AtpI family protein [Thermomicrobiales bacterium]|nr:AtpZ/AtpI family protein [Thermomicrobiales bacterium]
MDNPLGPETKRDWQAIGVASGLGFTIVGSLLLCVGGGILLDRWLGTMPIFTLIGVVLGLGAAGYALYELAMLGDPNRGRVRLKSKTDTRSQGDSGSRSRR